MLTVEVVEIKVEAIAALSIILRLAERLKGHNVDDDLTAGVLSGAVCVIYEAIEKMK